MLLGLIRSCRPVQWVKNLLVLAAPAAAGQLFRDGIWWRESIIFGLFCAAASGIYLVNDCMDREADRAHSRKRERPIAAGDVTVAWALAVAVVLVVASTAGALVWCNRSTVIVLAVYITLSLAYSAFLKHLPIVDMAVLAAFFMLRTVAGGTVADIPLSQWFLITVGFASLMAAGAKRYSELQMLGHGGGTRGALRHYTPEYLRFVWQAGATAAVLTYCLWATSEPASGSVLAFRELSIVPMVMVVLRYCQLTDRGRAEEPEEVLLRDGMIQIFGVCWAVTFVVAASLQ